MSKKVDERVVSMQFDNKNFESNVAQTMSTLDKLKAKLSFKGATKGLEDVGNAANKVNMSGLTTSVDTVSMRFSALQVAGVTALANITNSAVNAGKNMVKALTLDPIISGFREYETQMNSVQTILANTQSKGTTIDDVNAALQELNEYADQTIYNFTEMTRNIGTFTAAGVDLDKSVTSIKGIANLAAMSGSNAQQAATAMYQLSQALAAGRVSLMDWNSVVNAGMGGEVFQNALKRTAEHFGTNVDGMIEKYGSFRESLTQGEWLTAEVLTETLTQLSGAYTEADLIAQGYSESQAKEIVQLSKTALSAATDVKTFTGMIDTLKESVGSGWAQTWQIIFGDFEEAKSLWTGISNVLTGFVNKMSTARNELLGGALSSKWDEFSAKIEEAGVSTDTFQQKLTEVANQHGVSIDKMIEEEGSLKNAIDKGKVSKDLLIETLKSLAGVQEEAGKSTEDMTGKLEEFQKVVSDVWRGDYENGEERVKALTEAGYDYAQVQELVNKTVDGHKLTLEDLSDAQLENVGYTKEEITAIRQLAEEAEKSGTSMNQLIEQLSRPTGRELLFESFANILQPISTILKSIGTAWRDAFPKMSSETLYNLIDGFHSFTEALTIGGETAKNLTSTLKGVFAILDMVTTILGGGFKIAFTVVTKVIETLWKALGFGSASILEITGHVGEAIAGFRDWFESINPVTKAIEVIVPLLVELGKGIANFVVSLGDIPAVETVLNGIAGGFKAIGDALNNLTPEKIIDALISLKDNIAGAFSNLNGLLGGIPGNIIDGLANGLREGVGRVAEIMIDIGKSILDAIKGVLGIHSPSTEMESVGENAILGLLNGLQNGVEKVFSVAKDIGAGILDILGNIPWGKVFAGALTVGIFATIKKFSDILTAFTAPAAGIGSVLDGVGEVLEESAKSISKVIKNAAKVVKSFSKVLNAKAFQMNASAILDLAKAIVILAASVFILAQLDSGKLWSAVGSIAALATILGIFAFAVDKMSKSAVSIGKGGINIKNMMPSMVSIGAAILLLGATVKLMGSMDPEEAKQGFIGLTALVVEMGAFIAAYGLLVKGKSAQNIGKVGSMMIKMSVSLLIMVGVMKLVSMLKPDEVAKGGAAVLAFVGIVAALTAITKLGKNMDKLGGTLIKMSMAMVIMVGVIKLVSGLEPGELAKGGAAILAFVGIIAILTKVTQIGKNSQIAKLGGVLLSMSMSLLIMVGVCKLVGMLSVGEVVKGGLAIVAFTLLIKSMVGILKIGNDVQMAKVGATILSMSVAIGIMAGVAVVLSLIDLAGLAKGVAAVAVLGTIMSLMIKATRGASDVKGNLIAMTVAIGIMTASVVALSFVDPASLAGATAALGTLMGMFALIAKSASNIQTSMGTLIVMTVAVGVLAGILYLLSSLPIESSLAAASSLSILLLSVSESMLIMSKAGAFASPALTTVGVITLVVAGLAGILALMSAIGVENAIPNAIALSTLLMTLTSSVRILSIIGPMASAAIPAAGAMAAVIGIIAAVVAAAGAIKQIPGADWLVSEGAAFLQSIGEAIGGFVGGIIGGGIEAATSTLPQVGTNLSDFMTNLSPFLEASKSIDSSSTEGVKNLAQTLLILTGANLVDSLTSWLTGGNSLADFAAQLVPFGHGMKMYADAVAGIDAASISASASAAKALADVANAIPNEGGLVSLFAGENDMSQFATKLVPFGQGLKKYSEVVAGIDAVSIEASAKAAKAVAKVAEAIPNEGGILSLFAGENDLSSFGQKLVPFGKGLKQYATAVVGITEESVTNISNSAKAAKSLAKVAEAIPNEGGLVSLFTGDNSIGDFGNNLVPFGKGLKQYSDAVSGINMEAINNSVSAVKKLTNMMKTMGDINTAGIASFQNALSMLGKVSVNSAVSSLNGAAPSLTSSGANLADALARGIRSKQSSVTSATRTLVNAMVKAIESKKSAFNSAGVACMTQLANGIKRMGTSVRSAVASAMSSAVSSLRSYYSSFYSAGAYVAQGFANGISANSYMAAAKARAMANAAASAARAALDEHSPSKVFYKIGDFAGQGFVNALGDYVDTAYDSGFEMADSARAGLASTMRKIADIINSDVDTQPTIRPVLDLSELKAGVGDIDGLFGTEPSLGILSRTSRISAMMSNRQNGSNSDVVSAINKLRASLGNGGSNVYNINGITYDDGSNIESAVKELVRAARVERRK